MSKTQHWIVLAVAMVLGLSPAVGAQVPAWGRVEPAVYDQLAASAQGRTYVIVLLRGERLSSRADLHRHMARVQDLRGRVLARMIPGDFELAYGYRTIPAMTGRVDAAGLAKLAADPEVVSVGVDARGAANLDQSVGFIGADSVHAMSITGEGITVAVLDTGIDTDHPDLLDDLAVGAWHFLDEGADVGPGAEDDNGHGTNVAGIITSKGVVAPLGVAPDTDILAIKVLDAGSGGWASDWMAGVDYVTSVVDDYDDLCAINLSLGSFVLYDECPCDDVDTFNMGLEAALAAAQTAGITVFASSGNTGSCTEMSSPACLTSATAVAAVYDQDLGLEPDSGTYQDAFGISFDDCSDATTAGDKITCFSNRSGCNELAAPGRLIEAPEMGGGTGPYTGTSQAAPHCTALAALMCEKSNPTPAQIVQLMKDTGLPTDDPCGTSPNPIRINALAAIQALPCITTAPYCPPGTSASGCFAAISASGTPSAFATSGFSLHITGIEGRKDGLFYLGTNGRQANPWGSGTSLQCVVPPVVRTPLLPGTGTLGTCDGSFSLDLNALWCPTCPSPQKNPGGGAVVQTQLWYRDPFNTSNQTTSLSGALEFTVCP